MFLNLGMKQLMSRAKDGLRDFVKTASDSDGQKEATHNSTSKVFSISNFYYPKKDFLKDLKAKFCWRWGGGRKGLFHT